jgi:soluble lytic murein transglycosylase-like protein
MTVKRHNGCTCVRLMRRLLLALALGATLPIAAQTTTTDKPADKPQKKSTQKPDEKAEKKPAAEEKKPADVKSVEKKTEDKKSSDDKKKSPEEKKSADTKTAHKKKSHDDSRSDVFPDIEHERVDYWVAAFSKMKDYHKKIAGGFERKAKYQDLLERKLRKRGMPQNLIYLAFEESAFNTEARSREKANGIWQLTAATARLYGLKVNKKVDQRMEVEKETDAALRFLNHLHNRFGSWYLAAAAYDSGENRIARLMRKHFKREKGRDRDYYKIWNDLPGETRDYVPAIVALKRIGQNPSKYGF